MQDIEKPCAELTGAGAPADEIEITPAMLAAGVAGLPQGDEDFNSEFVTQEEIVARVYRAMVITQKAGVQNGALPDAC